MEPVDLTDERLLLRPYSAADEGRLRDAVDDPEIARWIGAIPSPYSLADARHFIAEIAQPGWVDGTTINWFITDRSTGEGLGGIGLHARLEAVFEVGFWLAAAARGRGVMTDSVRLVARYAFDVLGAQRVEWQAQVGNEASRAVARRVGFREEGTCRGRLQHSGQPRDAWLAGLLPGDLPGGGT
jgi:RimJ/RimL family protein N-acetyltransferase